MEGFWHTLTHLHDPEVIKQIIGAGGIYAMNGIVFAETGLLLGFFLPGDSLLITAGALAYPDHPNHLASLNMFSLNVSLIVAAVVGNQLGHFLGGKVGDRVWEKPDGRFYKRRYLEEAHEVFQKWGWLAIVGTRFVPIMRTFVPFASGMARMPVIPFLIWNVVGGVLWITSLLWAGYLLSRSGYANRLDKFIVIVIVVSFLPMVFGVVKRWLSGRAKPA